VSKSITRASADLRRLQDEGYDLEIRGGFLLVHQIPYVTPAKEVAYGTLVSTLELAGEVTTAPQQHEMHFVGEKPCDADGVPLSAVINQSQRHELAPGLSVDHFFSSKPAATGHYSDYYEKVATYATILVTPARRLDPGATPLSHPLITEDEDGDPVFNYTETASSRADIVTITEKLRIGPVAIIGLGGTGAYVLDFLAKTPVREIHIFDADVFAQHNAFRAPGAASREELAAKPQKVDYLKARYEAMRRGIVAHDCFVDESNVDQLVEMDFVFLALDESEPKRAIVEYLEKMGKSFIDVGMGLEALDGSLRGQIQTTTSVPAVRDHFRRRVSLADPNLADDYDQNIQVAELNALNAALAVIRFKKLYGFYADDEGEHTSVYVLEGNRLLNEDCS
jgi:molybdopterin/thiamine biosynthesis adenylyltransferase